MNILITGRTGSGKTTIARALAPLIGATVFDGDTIRNAYPIQVGFTLAARIKHAVFMRTLCEQVTAGGNHAIASFVAPTLAIRKRFKADFTIFCTDAGDRKYADTNMMWETPIPDEVHLYASKAHLPRYWAELAAQMIQPSFNPMLPTALFVGRFQPFHDGHKALIVEGIKRYGQVTIGVRDQNREWPFQPIKQRIDAMMRAYAGRYTVIPLPNIAAVCYGRDVGYKIEKIELPQEIENISATAIRRISGLCARSQPTVSTPLTIVSKSPPSIV